VSHALRRFRALWHVSRRFQALSHALRRLRALSRTEAGGGMALTVAAVVALGWANLWGHSYHHFWAQKAPWSSPVGLTLSLRDWVNQGLLFAFFTLIGLEIRREITAGELRSARRAAVPVGAALAGMAVPAVVYTAVVSGHQGARGWGIPMATDVAFALGALALIGRVPPRGRVFLLTLAVADDIASILVLIVFYRANTHFAWLPLGVIGVGAAAALWWQRRGWPAARVALIAVSWWGMLRAGIEAAVLGVALGLIGPGRAAPGTPPGVRRWELRLEPAVNLLVLPVFALANVGITLGSGTLAGAGAQRIFWAVVAARTLGKPVGVITGAVLTRRAVGRGGAAPLPRRHLQGVAALSSIGFTVPLLIIAQALPAGRLADAATAGLLVGSLLGAALAAAVLRTGSSSKPLRRPSVVGVPLGEHHQLP
jgi:NhaA family Na+:H+ antiporter